MKILHFCLWLFALIDGFTVQAVTSWPRFRGPNGQGVAKRDRPPTEFGPTTNLLWKAELPGGVSSPCVWSDQIFLTAFSTGKLETLSLNRSDGSMRWRQAAPVKMVHQTTASSSPASATPVTDGHRVYV